MKIQLVDYSGSLSPYIPSIEREFMVKIAYTKGEAKTKGKKDAENFLKHVLGNNKVWVIPHPLEHNDGPIFGYTQDDRAVVSTHKLNVEEVFKVVLHELGHILGLTHCFNNCCMYNIHPSKVPSSLCDGCKQWLLSR